MCKVWERCNAISAVIKGAFDNVWHTGILHQLLRWGCLGGMMKVVGRLLDGQSGEVAASWRSRNGKSSNIRMFAVLHIGADFVEHSV